VDGWQMKVVDLYNEPTLFVRSPEADAEQKISFPSDDPYFSEISAWIDASEHSHHDPLNESAVAEDDEKDIPNGILSSFRDSCGTYALTWYFLFFFLRSPFFYLVTNHIIFCFFRAIKEASERAKKTAAKPTQ
jgi:hypothetical protein